MEKLQARIAELKDHLQRGDLFYNVKEYREHPQRIYRVIRKTDADLFYVWAKSDKRPLIINNCSWTKIVEYLEFRLGGKIVSPTAKIRLWKNLK